MESKTERVSSTSSNNAVQSLLSEIYTQYQIENHFDSSTEASCFSDGVHVHCESNLVMMNSEEKERLHPTNLISNSFDDLLAIKEDLKQRIVVISAKLVRQLKQRNRLKEKNLKHCDTITAVLQAVSQKRWEDTQLKFTLDPYPNKKGFVQWYSALRAIVQLPLACPHAGEDVCGLILLIITLKQSIVTETGQLSNAGCLVIEFVPQMKPLVTKLSRTYIGLDIQI